MLGVLLLLMMTTMTTRDLTYCFAVMTTMAIAYVRPLGANYKKILRLSYDVIITYDNRKSNL